MRVSWPETYADICSSVWIKAHQPHYVLAEPSAGLWDANAINELVALASAPSHIFASGI